MKRLMIMTITILLLAAPVHAATPIPDADAPEAKVYTARCSACHALPHPKRLYFKQWEHMLNLMYVRISERSMEPLSDEDQKAILVYLKRHAR